MFSERMWRLYYNITTIELSNESPLKRWLISVVILLSKNKGIPKIYRIHIINTYELEYNLVLKYVWPKIGMKS